MNPTIKEGDIFITVLSMALVVDNISTTIMYYYHIKKGVHAALYIRNFQQFDYQFMVRIPTDQRKRLRFYSYNFF